jgi:hypothetical protein
MKPHKHAEVIHAWADGKTVQHYSAINEKWIDLNPEMRNWKADDYEYRIKPTEKVVRWLWLSKQYGDIWYMSTTYMTEPQAQYHFDGGIQYQKLEWSRQEFDE